MIRILIHIKEFCKLYMETIDYTHVWEWGKQTAQYGSELSIKILLTKKEICRSWNSENNKRCLKGFEITLKQPFDVVN